MSLCVTRNTTSDTYTFGKKCGWSYSRIENPAKKLMNTTIKPVVSALLKLKALATKLALAAELDVAADSPPKPLKSSVDWASPPGPVASDPVAVALIVVIVEVFTRVGF